MPINFSQQPNHSRIADDRQEYIAFGLQITMLNLATLFIVPAVGKATLLVHLATMLALRLTNHYI